MAKSARKPIIGDSAKPDSNRSVNPIDDPREAIDFYMPLPDEVFRKWRKK